MCIAKIIAQFCYLTLYLDNETFLCRLLDMDWNLKNLSHFYQLMPRLQKSPKHCYGYKVLPNEINLTDIFFIILQGHFAFKGKDGSYDFSTE